MDVSLFDFDLPEHLIALRPAQPRDSARLMVVRADGSLNHAQVRDIGEFLRPGDVLVLNDTKVIPARLHGVRLSRGAAPDARIEVLLCRRLGTAAYSALARPARKLQVGDRLRLGRSITATVSAKADAGMIALAFDLEGAALDTTIVAEGETPLPPYIGGRRKADLRDAADYQTIYARQAGSVAAPTAGLHFTPALFQALESRGIARQTVTLHVGPGTFLPVSATDTSEHRMHAEWARLDSAAATCLNAARASGGRIVAVGTTAIRTLESAADENGLLRAYEGDTDIFITPGYRFRTAEVLLTNFHLPRSTLFMLVSAFSGTTTMKKAYSEAIREAYRFYSYGDACLLFR
ncbi:MAG: tRNA preQ1(34) S-adenosylmethionine ribosyltransferase-isomerase QueA [Alphaproteobacteria bacterium]|nr:tRNA preQ1(34) S-adenosylmethionine ribosyltransferase-isomerase QueA [Alphaproteobacteria bacterium]